MKGLRDAFLVFSKDVSEYYGKAPTISWGLLFPVTLVVLMGYYASGMGAWRLVPGLISVTLLFSATTLPQVAVGFDKMSGGINLFIYSPVRSWSLMLGKSLGGVFLGMLGSGVAVLVLRGLGSPVPAIHPAYLAFGLITGSLAFSALGVLLAALLEPTDAVATLNFLRFTMIFLGGGLMPEAIIPSFLKPLIYALPMVYVSDTIRYGMYNTYEFLDPYTASIGLAIYLAALVIVSFKALLKILMP